MQTRKLLHGSGLMRKRRLASQMYNPDWPMQPRRPGKRTFETLRKEPAEKEPESVKAFFQKGTISFIIG